MTLHAPPRVFGLLFEPKIPTDGGCGVRVATVKRALTPGSSDRLVCPADSIVSQQTREKYPWSENRRPEVRDRRYNC
jgi:hypothetical protein